MYTCKWLLTKLEFILNIPLVAISLVGYPLRIAAKDQLLGLANWLVTDFRKHRVSGVEISNR